MAMHQKITQFDHCLVLDGTLEAFNEFIAEYNYTYDATNIS